MTSITCRIPLYDGAIRKLSRWMLLAGFFFIVTLAAAELDTPTPEQSPLALVQKTSEEVLGLLQSRKGDFKNNPYPVCKLVDAAVARQFDFESMSKWVLGKYWRNASEQQRRDFEKEYRELLVRTYSTALLEYAGYSVSFRPVHVPKESNKVIVRTQLALQGGNSVSVHYRLHRVGDGWKVYDLLIDGVSIVTTYRRTFANNIEIQGLDALIQRLADRNSTLRRGL